MGGGFLTGGCGLQRKGHRVCKGCENVGEEERSDGQREARYESGESIARSSIE